MSGLTISQVAKASNVNIETVKYYERKGLISKPPRTESGYRMFPADTVEDIVMIKRAQAIGFTLKEIQQFLTIVKQETFYPTEEMYNFATLKVHEIENKISQLQSFKSMLEMVTKPANFSQPLPKDQCPVLKKLIKG
ncbi:MerR family transcriptional regulator [Paenibacillus sp. L3-i20]|uniref:MerR family transcriptional regulator n=1 Tax=Paenibacillus sp. L3-i20 TaxID=2905833 RepID=UPI001EDFF299|nr:MerR family transcriptional regulator [Paenibacillus sp. L3-i20]GKU78896.1 Hg(II)-responsive transcriptional regulator [Paenibacillus sp. L3-i20]